MPVKEIVHYCHIAGCHEQATRQCDDCGNWYCDEHGQRGGDRQTAGGGTMAYPDLCNKCIPSY